MYYDGKEKPEEVWAELADGSCRWRQTGSEIKVICLKVPEDVAAKELDVSLQPFNIRVAHKHTKEVCYSIVLKPDVASVDIKSDVACKDHGRDRRVDCTMQVYLEGELERGIVPLESVWMHGRGTAEDGCLLMLQKMNLEVLQKYVTNM